MAEAKALSPVAKGQMRCFHCRRAFPMKEGGWHNYQNQQVFLCKICEHTPEPARPKGKKYG